MDLATIIIAIVTFLGWGVGAFFSKLSADRIGNKSVLFDLIGYFPALLIFSLLMFKVKDIAGTDKLGGFYGVLAGILGSFGIVGFYVLLSKQTASSIVPLTALYPALTVILAIIFLRESVTLDKVIGIVLSIVAIYFLARAEG